VVEEEEQGAVEERQEENNRKKSELKHSQGFKIQREKETRHLFLSLTQETTYPVLLSIFWSCFQIMLMLHPIQEIDLPDRLHFLHHQGLIITQARQKPCDSLLHSSQNGQDARART